MTRSTSSNGPAPRGGVSLPFEMPSTLNSLLPKSSKSRRPHARSDRQLAAQLRNDQHRRAAAAAQAAAGRRAVIAAALALLGMLGGAVVLVQEVGIQQVEVRRG